MRIFFFAALLLSPLSPGTGQFSQDARSYCEGGRALSEGGMLTGALSSASEGDLCGGTAGTPTDWPGCVSGHPPF